MKSVRNKKVSNSSFLSNHDLLSNFRNKSFKLITRQASLSELKQVPKKVSLIQKKNYEENNKDNKENDQLLSNRKMVNVTKGNTQRQKLSLQINPQKQIQKVIKELNFIYDQINVDEIQLKMILNKNIRKIKQIFSKNIESTAVQKQQENSEKELKDKIEFLNQKVEDQSKKIFKYKKDCSDLQVNILINQQKLSLYERQVGSLQEKLQEQKKINEQTTNSSKATQRTLKVNHSQPLFQEKQSTNIKPNKFQNLHEQINQPQVQILQNIIETQEQLISKQMSDFEAENQEFLRILQTQALQIEQLMMVNKEKQHEKHTPKNSQQDQKSTALQSKYDSSTTFRGPVVNGFSNYNSPQRTEDLIAKISKKKPKSGDFSIFLY